jgi:ribose-phosphate pyrophosphokinase
MAYESLMVFTGNANPLLAHAVVRRLNIPLGHATVGKFSDGEIMVELLENVRGKDCFVLQSTCAPANDSLMEVLLIVDALKRALRPGSPRPCRTWVTRARTDARARREWRSARKWLRICCRRWALTAC